MRMQGQKILPFALVVVFLFVISLIIKFETTIISPLLVVQKTTYNNKDTTNNYSNKTTTAEPLSNDQKINIDSKEEEQEGVEEKNDSLVSFNTNNISRNTPTCSKFYDLLLSGDVAHKNSKEPSIFAPASLTQFWIDSLQGGRIEKAILAAADNTDGKRDAELKDLAGKVLEQFTPARLRKSILNSASTSYSQNMKVGAILEKLQRIHHSLYHKTEGDNIKNRDQEKIRILVFGGSPTAGSNCYRNGRLKKIFGAKCAWPSHLQGFMNSLVGFDAFEVVNYAIGASDSEFATSIMHHKLLPPSIVEHGVDLIFYAYAVNDHNRFQGYNGGMKGLLHNFITTASTLTSCENTKPEPMVVLLDDMVVKNQGNQLEMVDYHSYFYAVSYWHDIPLISYSAAVQDIWFNNTDENFFLDYKTDWKHAPRGGHVSITLNVAFNIFNMLFEHCDDDILISAMNEKEAESLVSNRTTYQIKDSLLLPPLHDNPKQDEVTEAWNKNTIEAAIDKKSKCENGGDRKCAFAWVAMRREEEHAHLSDEPVDLIVPNVGNGWTVNYKWPPSNYGLYGSGANATVHLQVPGKASKVFQDKDSNSADIQIKMMEITYMKSYSEKWKNSLMRVEIRSNNTDARNSFSEQINGTMPPVLASANYSGYHEQLTSEYYTETLLINETQVGESVHVTFRMIEGYTFKIIALSFCS